MTTITRLQGTAAPIRIDNLDTDQIMPKQFLLGIDKAGLAQGLLYNLRCDSSGQAKPDFVLNRPEFAHATVLLGGSNFGCGSSREHAVWGMLQFGIKAIIAPSFGEIFHSNAMGNRLLLVTLPPAQVEALMHAAEQPGAPAITIDIEAQQVRCTGLQPMPFDISPRHKEMFLKGVDVVGMSLTHMDDIQAFAQQHWAQQPWLKDVAARMKARL